MTVRDKVYKFVSDWTEIPVSKLSDELDIVTDIDWEKHHPDERGPAFIDVFFNKFEIYVPGDYSDFAKKIYIPKVLKPILSPFYAAFAGDPLRGINFEHITIGDLIKIAEAGHWIDGPGHSLKLPTGRVS